MTVAVWVGYPEGAKPMETEYRGEPVAGGTFPAEIWHDFMVNANKIRAARSAKENPDKPQVGPTGPVTPAPAAPATTEGNAKPETKKKKRPSAAPKTDHRKRLRRSRPPTPASATDSRADAARRRNGRWRIGRVRWRRRGDQRRAITFRGSSPPRPARRIANGRIHACEPEGGVEDQAPRGGLSPNMKAHFARLPLGLENSGLSYFRIAPNFRLPFGHKHRDQEEVYVLMSGSGRMKLDDEVIELKPWDALRVPGYDDAQPRGRARWRRGARVRRPQHRECRRRDDPRLVDRLGRERLQH